uniref:SH3 domain containing GRB2 like, endophilin B2 n=1 Tax=Varanus komodoensis TaxID=61221 RepID=A0A8D2ITI1_VARKO
MDFNMKKLASDAGVFFTRAVQFTEEKLGQAEKTELDAPFEKLLVRADSTKNWTEKILRQTEILLQPNPSARVEEFLYEKLDRKVPSRVTNGELLAQYMIEAANDFGPTSPYGKTLIKVGETERRLGGAERDFIHSASINFLSPLRNFLEGDWRTISKERRILENRRLDLDACKARLKKAKAAEAKAAAEHELRLAQTEFDRQAEVTRLLLEGISSTHVRPRGGAGAPFWGGLAGNGALGGAPSGPPSRASVLSGLCRLERALASRGKPKPSAGLACVLGGHPVPPTEMKRRLLTPRGAPTPRSPRDGSSLRRR